MGRRSRRRERETGSLQVELLADSGAKEAEAEVVEAVDASPPPTASAQNGVREPHPVAPPPAVERAEPEPQESASVEPAVAARAENGHDEAGQSPPPPAAPAVGAAASTSVGGEPPLPLTLEPPPSRTTTRAKAHTPLEKKPAAPRARRPDAVPPSAPARAAKDSATAGRDENGAVRDQAAARPRPAGEPLARARSLVEQGKIQEAIELYLGILTVNPSNLKARNNLGVLFDELKQFDAARDHLEAAARIEPENVEVLTNLASTLTSLARYEEAEAILRRAQKVDADDLRVRTAIGILYFRRGLYDQAESDLRSVCARDRDNGLAFYYRGEALNRLGRYAEAEEAIERAVELRPNDPKPVYTLGHLYDRKHLPDEAAAMYRRARQLQQR